MTKATEKLLAFAFGIVFISAILTLAIKFPNPTAFQYNVFRTVLALAAGGAAAMIPGFLTVTVSGWIRAGGALAVFVLVYFYSPAGLAIANGMSVSQIGAFNRVTINQSDEIARANLPVDIEGAWDQGRAEHLAMSELGKWKAAQSAETDPSVHELVKVSDLIYKDHQSKILSYSSALDGGCHACAPYLSFFEFEKRAHGWKMTNSQVGGIQFGSWGRVLPDELSVRVIGDNTYGIFFNTCDMAQGVSVCWLLLSARLADSFKDLLKLKSSEDDQGKTGWSSTISIVPTPAGLYDVLVERKGYPSTQDLKVINMDDSGDPEIVDQNNEVRPRDIFKFDGDKYVRSDVYK